MSCTRFAAVLCVCLALAITAAPATSGTFTCLSCTDEHPSWALPRINSAGDVALVRGETSGFGGALYLWTGSWEEIVAFPGCSVVNYTVNHPKLELNDNGRAAFLSSGSENVSVADTTGFIPLGTAPTPLNYAIDINDYDQIAAYSYHAWLNNHIYTSDDPYTTYSDDVGPADIIQFRIAYNNLGQIAWKPPSTSTIYRFTPGIGSEAIGVANYATFDIDDLGRVLYLADWERLMLNDMQVRTSEDLAPSAEYGHFRISDNGRFVVWTEKTEGNWELWTLLDGMPTNLTLGSYYRVASPDVNNDGLIVFQSIESTSWPYDSHVYMYEPDPVETIVYNGHFDGETLFGWVPSAEGAAVVDLVTAGAGFAAQLTSGSPASLGQMLDVPTASSTLAFDVDFLTSNGTLTVSLAGVVVATLTSADDTEPGFTSIEIDLSTTPPLGEEDALLLFSLDDATSATVQIDNVSIEEGGSGIDELPDEARIARAHPNPFATETTLEYALAQAGHVEAKVYTAAGRLVRTLLDERQDAGIRSLSWDGRDDAGAELAPGVYFVRILANGAVRSSKTVIVR